MNKDDLMGKYAFYAISIHKIIDFSMEFSPSMEEAGMGRAEVQSAYKEARQMGFKGNMVDYVCYVATAYSIIMSGKLTPLEVAKFWNENLKDRPEIRAALRLFRKHPGYFYSLLDSEWDEKSAAILDRLWYMESGFLTKQK